MDFDVIVLGAGAAGMMCAAVAGRRGRRVLLVEHAAKLGEKIRISGGGRCNFTNLQCAAAKRSSRAIPHFCRSALARYTPRDFIALVERHGIAYHEKTLGQLFCDDSAAQIIAMLQGECDAAGVRWAMPCDGGARRARRRKRTTSGVSRSRPRRAASARASLVVATGGLSIPKIGATPFGYRIAEQFGLPVVAPQPALVPLAAPPEWLAQFGELSGTSFDAIASCAAPRGDAPRFARTALITHRGLSGPAILQISSYWQLRADAAGDARPAARARRELHGSRRIATTIRRWARCSRSSCRGASRSSFAQAHGWTQPLAQLSNADLETIAQTLKDWRIQPSGTLGYAKAEVTLGGVDTDALSQQTMEARARAGPLLHRRSRRRHRLARRLQLPVGVVFGPRRGHGGVARSPFCCPILLSGLPRFGKL